MWICVKRSSLQFLDFILTTGHMLIALANMTHGIPERNSSRNNKRNLDYTNKLVLVTGENLTDTSVLDYESSVISLSVVYWDNAHLPLSKALRVLQTVVIIEHKQAVTDWAVLINQVFLPHQFRANKPTGLLKSRPDLITTAETQLNHFSCYFPEYLWRVSSEHILCFKGWTLVWMNIISWTPLITFLE